jgi:hypothetical protein
MDRSFVRWTVGLLAALAIVALLAWARNGPGVGGRFPDPPQSGGRVEAALSIRSQL